MGSNPTATATSFFLDRSEEILANRENTIINIERKFLWICANSVFVLFMFPSLVINGIFRKEILIGDPLYTSRIKYAAKNPFDLGSGYVTDPAATGNREIISLGETVIGLLGKILNLSIWEIYIYSTIAMGLLALYLFSKILSNRNKKVTFLLCSGGLFLFWGPHNDFNFARPISPQITILVYLVIMFGIKKSLSSNVRKFKLLIGVLAGLSAYLSSPFTFIAASIAFFTYLFLTLTNQKITKIDYASLASYVILIVPYMLANLANSGSESFSDLTLRQGLIDSHLPAARVTIITLILILSYIMMFYKFKKIKIFNNQNLFLNFLIIQSLTIAIVSNSNLITGKALQFSNHFDHFSKIILILVIGSTLDSFNLTNSRLSRIFYKLKSSQLIPISLAFTLVTLMVIKGLSVKEIEKPTLKEQRIWSFIDKNIKNDAVILFSNIGMSAAASALIENELFFSTDMFNFNYTQKEINFRYFATTACSVERIDKSSWSFTYGLRGLDKIGKVDRYINYVKKLRIDDVFLKSLLLQQSQEVTNYANLVAMSEKDSRELKGIGCLNFIKSRNVKYLVVENNEAWKLLASKQLISFVSKVDSVFVYKIN